MANKNGVFAPARGKSKPLRYFYLNGLLHKKLHINRGADEITAWCYPTERRVTYPYQDTRRRLEPAFTTAQVATMLNRRRLTLERAILTGNINPPQFTYGLESRKKFKYMWSEKDILEAHEFLSSVHVGRPRLDGMVTPKRLPTARELRAMIRQQEILYIQVDGEFRPTWEAPDI